MTTPTGAAVTIAAQTRRLSQLLPQLSAALGDKAPAPEVSTTHRAPSSRPPLGPAGYALLAIHAGVRDIEASLRTYVVGDYWRRTSTDDDGTQRALHAIAAFSTMGLPDEALHDAERELQQLVDQAERVPHVGEHPAEVALNAGVRCPHCGLRTLTSGGGAIECANIRCEDPVTQGQPRWSKAQWPALLRQLTARR